MSFDLPDPGKIDIEAIAEPPEVFSQSVEPDAAPPEAEPQAEPQPTSDPVQDLPEVEPDWINAQPEQQGPHPGQYPQEPPPQLPPPQPGYQQPQPQYQQPQPTGVDQVLNEFVSNPKGFIQQIQQETLNQFAGPMGYQQQQMAQEINQMRQTYADGHVGEAKDTVVEAYKHLNKNPTFRSNKQVQDSIKGTLQEYRNQAEMAARAGNYGPIAQFNKIGPEQLNGMMAYLSATMGVQSPGVGPLQVEGATVESSRSAVDEGSVVLTPLQEDIASRMGPGKRDEMIQAEKDLLKYNDFEVNG
jgi:hypothetical protein